MNENSDSCFGVGKTCLHNLLSSPHPGSRSQGNNPETGPVWSKCTHGGLANISDTLTDTPLLCRTSIALSKQRWQNWCIYSYILSTIDRAIQEEGDTQEKEAEATEENHEKGRKSLEGEVETLKCKGSTIISVTIKSINKHMIFFLSKNRLY